MNTLSPLRRISLIFISIVFSLTSLAQDQNVPGCMNVLYTEFNSAANVEDASCSTLIVTGCMDTTAFNYDSLANIKSCVNKILVCFLQNILGV